MFGWAPDHRSPMTDHRIHSPQPRRRPRPPALQTIRSPAERPHSAEEPPATLAAIEDLAATPELSQRGSFGSMAGLCSEQARHPPEDRSVGHARSSRRERPGMCGLVPQRVLLLAFRQVSRDRDAVWSPVLDLAARQLARGEPYARRTEVEQPREAVVQELQTLLVVGRRNREEQFQLEIRLAASRARFDGARPHFWRIRCCEGFPFSRWQACF